MHDRYIVERSRVARTIKQIVVVCKELKNAEKKIPFSIVSII
jgi:hypothetical protein